tara:strand:+ start:1188 stop:2129 length:942 start_codon:yes stop_codon:yes gene_type:complete
MNIKDVLGKYKLAMSKSFSGELLKYTEMSVDDFKIDKKYQRHISPAYIRKGGPLNLARLTPIVVCERPNKFGEDSGFFVVDGQHRTLRVIHSDYTGKVPVVVLKHNETATLEECVEIEAKMFHDLNSLGKSTTKVDEVRAGIYSNDKKALHTLNVMELLHLTCDNFGSEEDDAREVKVFTHFYLMCNQDYDETQTSKILAGYNLHEQLFPGEATIQGDAVRAMSLLVEFIAALTNGKQERFSAFVHNVLPQFKTVKSLTKGRATAQSPRFILHDIITMYNESQKTEHYRIGASLVEKLGNAKLGGNSRFLDPN